MEIKKVSLNKDGEKVLKIWKDCNNVNTDFLLKVVSQLLNEMVENGELTPEVRNIMLKKHYSHSEMERVLLDSPAYSNTEIETMETYRVIVTKELEGKGITHILTTCDEDNIYITKRLGYSKRDIQRYFELPVQPEEFKKPRGRCSELKLETLKNAHKAELEEYNKCIEELNIAIDLFAKYRLPKVGAKILKKLEKQISKHLEVFISSAYYSENIEGYNVDLVMKLSYDDYYNVFIRNNSSTYYCNNEKENLIKSINYIVKKGFSTFMDELDS